MRLFSNLFFYNNFLISIGASLLFIHYALALQVNFFLNLPLSIFAGTLLIYNLLQIIPYYKKENYSRNFVNLYLKHKALYKLIGIMALIPIFYSLFDLSYRQVIIATFAGLGSIFYTKARSLPYLKTFLIPFVWSLVCVGLQNTADLSELIIPTAECFVFIFLLCAPFDIKDLEVDLSSGIKTLPQLVQDPARVKILLVIGYGAYLLAFDLLLFQYVFEFLIYTMLLAISQRKNSAWIYYLGFDGLVIFRSIQIFF